MGLVEVLDAIPPPLAVIVLAFSPVGEVRVSVPVGILHYDMSWGEAIVWSLLGNLAVAPAATYLYKGIEAVLRRWAWSTRVLDRIYAKTRNANSDRIRRWEEAAVALFIAVPLPGSGAWSGVLVAHVFGLEWKKTWSYFYAGVVLATFLITILVTTGRWGYGSFA